MVVGEALCFQTVVVAVNLHFDKDIKDYLNVINEWTLARQVYGEILILFQCLSNR